MTPSLRHPLIEACGIQHEFGLRGRQEPPGVRRPKQVHGTLVVDADDCSMDLPPEADAIISSTPGLPIAVVTADCVPVLVAARDGRLVAAIHAGWRGLAAGVIEAGIRGMERSGVVPSELVAVVGPHIGRCCYEVDAPVVQALDQRFGSRLGPALEAVRPGHDMLDLGLLAREELLGLGLAPAAVAQLDACTHCDPERFHSYRRDGPRSGRLVHSICAGGAEG